MRYGVGIISNDQKQCFARLGAWLFRALPSAALYPRIQERG